MRYLRRWLRGAGSFLAWSAYLALLTSSTGCGSDSPSTDNGSGGSAATGGATASGGSSSGGASSSSGSSGGAGLSTGGTGGTGGSTGGTGGSTGGTGGSTGGTGGSTGGTGGAASGGSAGSGGSATSGGASASGGSTTGGAASAPSLDDLDLTLGGMNQDLPVPALDCVAVDAPSSGCTSWTGEYNGDPFNGACRDASRGSYIPSGSTRGMECDFQFAPNDSVGVGFSLGEDLLGKPPATVRTFTAVAPPQPDIERVGAVVVRRDARKFVTHDFGSIQISETHDYSFRVAGVSAHPPGPYAGQISESVRGVFAVSATPKTTCVKDASGFRCDSIRLRGTFHVRTIDNVLVYGPLPP